MTTLKAVLIVALVFGVFTMGPVIVTFVGIALAIVVVRGMLLQEKEESNGKLRQSDYTDFIR